MAYEGNGPWQRQFSRSLQGLLSIFATYPPAFRPIARKPRALGTLERGVEGS